MILRQEVQASDTWDLLPLYQTLEEWRSDYEKVEGLIPSVASYPGTLATSPTQLKAAVERYLEMNRSLEKVYVFAHLRSDEDTGNSENLGQLDQAVNLATRVSEAWSFFTPELLSLPADKIDSFLSDPQLAAYRRMLEETLRYKAHTLSEEQEFLLASGAEVFGSCDKIFSQLNNADLSFPPIKVGDEERPLSHGTYTLFLKHPDRSVREAAFRAYYQVFDGHRNTIAATLSGSIKKNLFLAKAKRYPSSRAAALFGDDVPLSVYDNLIDTVGKNLEPLHRYYQLRKKLLELPEMNIFDTYVPLVPNMNVRHTYEEAVSSILESLAPLGEEYVGILRNGLGPARWVDRYENKGKRSGAYSSGCYDSHPYILMNFKEDSFNDVFTLTHEAGHSMHTYFSNRSQSYQDHNYTIFVAEVASTLNEQLLCKHLEQRFKNDPKMLAYLINHQIDDIKSTLYRQTMFAEFEKLSHGTLERNEPLTIDVMRKLYRGLLEKYFGNAVTVTDLDELECLRIPHFYSAFYVYKYATGISAAIALSQLILSGSNEHLERYLKFLQSGGSKYPLELLRDAGVDMAKPAPVESALKVFGQLVDRLEKCLAHPTRV